MTTLLRQHVVLGATVVRVADVQRSADWYREKLGVDVKLHPHQEHPTALFHFGKTLFRLWQLQPGEPGPRGSTSDPYIVAVVPTGIDEIHAGLVEGGADVSAITAARGFRFFRVRDPDGNLIEVTSPEA